MERISSVVVRNVIFGGGEYLPCITLKPSNTVSLIEQAENALLLTPAAIEWRIDYFNPMVDGDFSTKVITQSLHKLRGVLDETPLILTFRAKVEACDPNLRFHSEKMRLRTINGCINTGLVDIVDIEIDSDNGYLATIREIASANQVKLMLSHSHFDHLPDEDAIIERLLKAQSLGADMVRCAYMTWSNQDVMRVCRATKKAKETLRIPVSCYGMGDVGSISRMLGDRYGSDFCFFSLNDYIGGVDEPIGIYYDTRDALRIKGRREGLAGDRTRCCWAKV